MKLLQAQTNPGFSKPGNQVIIFDPATQVERKAERTGQQEAKSKNSGNQVLVPPATTTQ